MVAHSIPNRDGNQVTVMNRQPVEAFTGVAMRLISARSVLVIFLVLMLSVQVLASSGGPPPENSKGESTVLSGCTCHGVGAPANGVASTEVVVSISGVPHSYDVDTPYELTITVEHSSNTAGGFILSSGGLGTFSWGEDANIRPADGSNDSKSATSTSDNISHSDTTDPAQWSFTWMAPSADVGDVPFYLAGNSVDAHGANDEQDAWNLLSFVINSPSSATSQTDLATRVISVGDYQSLFVSEPDEEAIEHERQLELADSVLSTGNTLFWSSLCILIVGAVFQREIIERKNDEGPSWLAKEIAYPQAVRRGVLSVVFFIIGLNWMADGSAAYLYAPAIFAGFWAAYGVYRTVLAAKAEKKVLDTL
tara:strand:- start:440 stop:1534 length:1095 start_codon:yes stop_codon:yes gene_type:complete